MTPIPPPDPPPPRRTARPFPTHRFQPGDQPHPKTLGWAPTVDFPYACDLFDHRYCWEAHEVWEVEWRTHDRAAVEAWLLQGLVCSAAFVIKQHQGILDGAERLLTRSHLCLRAVVDATGPVARGLHLPELFRRLHGFR
ncbi:MAG: DUF309 domain-containing protein, partial [Myxococcota bacterium]